MYVSICMLVYVSSNISRTSKFSKTEAVLLRTPFIFTNELNMSQLNTNKL